MFDAQKVEDSSNWSYGDLLGINQYIILWWQFAWDEPSNHKASVAEKPG